MEANLAVESFGALIAITNLPVFLSVARIPSTADQRKVAMKTAIY